MHSLNGAAEADPPFFNHPPKYPSEMVKTPKGLLEKLEDRIVEGLDEAITGKKATKLICPHCGKKSVVQKVREGDNVFECEECSTLFEIKR